MCYKILKICFDLSTDEWINRLWYIHTVEYYSAFKKELNSDTCYNMDTL